MNLQEQNWTNLFGNHTPEGTAWYGIWTRYSPELEVIKSFQGIRKFSANQDKTVITHHNSYTYADGSTEEKQWQIEKEIVNKPDGIIHPAFESMRTLSFSKEAKTWMCLQLKIGNLFGCELFFQHQNFRTSVASMYGENGELAGFTQIREHLNSYPDQKPGAELKNISGNWVGQKQSMTPDLQISQEPELTELKLDPTAGKNPTFFLPDGIVINVPEKVNIGEEFELVVGKMMIENKYKRMTIKYDKDGKFIQLISEVFDRKD
ncbi:DUF3598 family protein [Okeania sp. KiyG1]|uniref:DUF3598 family protein n=1 Tax=Okeania sp. KiyG1 TaxID=2720165 RepID=UPI001920C25D|nr:DUF3598 family protein [Okeania sp. KiyG1]GGA56836.1 hypothetical protein CYANOKiyG1_77810 [Okeania sp. KiyG1]